MSDAGSETEVQPFRVGERVVVAGGYDYEPDWLRGAAGYSGTLVEILGNWATVELDQPLALEAQEGTAGWPDFGTGSSAQRGVLRTATGRYLALALGWVGAEWEEPIARLHVAVCEEQPDLRAIPSGGGIGAWVESHAAMTHESPPTME